MVVGGYPWAESKEVEIFNTEDQGQSCTANVQFPVGVDGAIGGAFSDDAPVICGGGNSHLKATNQCFIQKNDGRFSEAKFALRAKRAWASSVSLPNGTLVVLGGYGQNGILSTMEIIDTINGEVRVPEQTLPQPISGHCSVLLNESFAFIIGGYNGSESRKTVFLDLQSLETTDGPEMNMTRSSFGCAISKNKVIVAGGYNPSTKTTEYLDLLLTSPSWQPGKLKSLLYPTSSFIFYF